MCKRGRLGKPATLLLALALGGTALPGCMIPTYQQPQGFSSTYYRHLQQAAAPPIVEMTEAPAASAAVSQAEPDQKGY